MGLLADDARFDRRSGLRALLIVLLALALGFGIAWMTLGRTARFQSLKGVFLSFDLPRSFVEVDEEGSGESLTSLGETASLERTFASTLPPREACRAIARSFTNGDVDAVRIAPTGPDVACSFAGPVGRFSLDADVRTSDQFLLHVQGAGSDIPDLPDNTRSIASFVASP